MDCHLAFQSSKRLEDRQERIGVLHRGPAPVVTIKSSQCFSSLGHGEQMVREIQLTRGKVALVDDEDYEVLADFKWCASRNKHAFYAYRALPKSQGKQSHVKMHRIILNAPNGIEVDHRDGDGLNNTRANLRLATRSQQQANLVHPSKINQFGFKGIHFGPPSRKDGSPRWRARIKVNQKLINLGTFKTLEEAARAYDEGARKFFGPFARPNFPNFGRYVA